MEALGPVPQRAPVGHGARGLQRQRRRLELLHPRSGALAGLQVGRGRHRRVLRRPSAAVLRDRRVERRRSDPQGADVRAHQRRGQPRRGRQGVLLLPRRHADELVPEVPLPLSARRLPVRRPRRDEPGSKPARLRVRAARHRGVRRQPLRRRRRRVRQARPGRHRGAHHRGQPQRRGGDHPPAAVAVVPQHVVDGRRQGHDARRRRLASGDRRRPRRPRWPSSCVATARRSCCSPRTRRTPSGCGGRPTPRRTSRTPFTSTSSHGRVDAVNPARTGTKAAALYELEIPAEGSRVVQPALVPGRCRGRRRRRPAVRGADRRGRPVLRLDHAVADDSATRQP